MLLELLVGLLRLLGEADVLQHEHLLHMLTLHGDLHPRAHRWALVSGRGHLLHVATGANPRVLSDLPLYALLLMQRSV